MKKYLLSFGLAVAFLGAMFAMPKAANAGGSIAVLPSSDVFLMLNPYNGWVPYVGNYGNLIEPNCDGMESAVVASGTPFAYDLYNFSLPPSVLTGKTITSIDFISCAKTMTQDNRISYLRVLGNYGNNQLPQGLANRQQLSSVWNFHSSHIVVNWPYQQNAQLNLGPKYDEFRIGPNSAGMAVSNFYIIVNYQ